MTIPKLKSINGIGSFVTDDSNDDIDEIIKIIEDARVKIGCYASPSMDMKMADLNLSSSIDLLTRDKIITGE